MVRHSTVIWFLIRSVLVDGISNQEIGVTGCIASKALVEPFDSLGISLRALGKDPLLATDN